ncbi:MAG: protein kinase [Pseudomonadota bacterium]
MAEQAQGLLSPGLVLNHTYEIVQLVGVGGTGEVYLARNQSSNREVAIKLLKREFAADPTLVELMQREANALHDIMHPAVVRYYELLRTDLEGGFTFLVMEFIRGESLEDRMARGPVPAEELLPIARRVVDGLEAAHAGSVLHRDLTPANVILRDGDPSRATLIDFGIAKDLSNTGKTVIGQGFAGTYQYASPEQIDAAPVDARSDFYSLGATLLAAAQGHKPGDGGTLEQILAGKRMVPETEALPGALRPLIQALMQPLPDERPATAADIRVLIDGMGEVEDLDALLDGTAEEKTVIRPRPEPAKGTARGTAPAPGTTSGGGIGWIAALVVAVAGLGAGAYFVLPGLLEPSLPVASPYALTLKVDETGAVLSGNAPSEEAAIALRGDLADALPEEMSLAGALVPATGLPVETWMLAMVELALAAEPLERWTLTAADTEIRLSGLAVRRESFETVETRAQVVAESHGLSLDFQVALAPQPLSHAAMLSALAAHSKCGPLLLFGPDPLPPGQQIAVQGPVATEEDAAQIREALAALDPARTIRLDLTVASELVCKVERLMPGSNSPDLSFDFSYGEQPGKPDSPDYLIGENPVVDLSIGAEYGETYLFVFYVDGNTGKVIHLLPYQDRPENLVNKAGEKTGERWRVRLLYPAADVTVGQRGFRVGPPYGTNILVAVASPEAFLENMMPRDDQAELFLEDLVAALTRAETTDYIVSREFFTTREN